MFLLLALQTHPYQRQLKVLHLASDLRLSLLPLIPTIIKLKSLEGYQLLFLPKSRQLFSRKLLQTNFKFFESFFLFVPFHVYVVYPDTLILRSKVYIPRSQIDGFSASEFIQSKMTSRALFEIRNQSGVEGINPQSDLLSEFKWKNMW